MSGELKKRNNVRARVGVAQWIPAVEKRQICTDEIEQKIMEMYAKGMSQRDIEDNLREMYGAETPQILISEIPRPRHIESDTFIRLRAELLLLVREEVEKSVEREYSDG